MMNSDEILLNLEYLNSGVVPPGVFYGESPGDKLKQSLDSMSHLEMIRSKRRFRKLFKKSLKMQIERIKSSLKGNGQTCSFNRQRLKECIHQLYNRAGMNIRPGEKLDIQHSRYRRVLVHHFLYDQMKDKK